MGVWTFVTAFVDRTRFDVRAVSLPIRWVQFQYVIMIIMVNNISAIYEQCKLRYRQSSSSGRMENESKAGPGVHSETELNSSSNSPTQLQRTILDCEIER